MELPYRANKQNDEIVEEKNILVNPFSALFYPTIFFSVGDASC